jgi:hypothetical protein
MRFITITTTASTRRIWINPPMVYEETRPSTQRISNIIAIVTNIEVTPYLSSPAAEPLNPE